MQERWLAAAAALAALVAGAACSSSPTAPSPVVEVGQPFELAPGDTVAVKAAGLSLRFERVVTDSRCPGDAICITAGEAELAFTLIATDRGAGPVSLRTSSPGNRLVSGGWVVVLSELSPYPFASRPPIDPQAYRATLFVDRAAQPAS
jgi:hypothetical protein